MTQLVDARADLTQRLADALRDLGETRARRRELWSSAIEQAAYTGANITTQRTQADIAVTHLDAQIDRLVGDIEAMKVEITQIDFEAVHHGE